MTAEGVCPIAAPTPNKKNARTHLIVNTPAK
jgi:hypothetical protein